MPDPEAAYSGNGGDTIYTERQVKDLVGEAFREGRQERRLVVRSRWAALGLGLVSLVISVALMALLVRVLIEVAGAAWGLLG